jgi:hypothetical protein
MPFQLKALQTYSGTEGFVKKGQLVEVESAERARKLQEMKICELVVSEELEETATSTAELHEDDFTHGELDSLALKNEILDYPKAGNKKEKVKFLNAFFSGSSSEEEASE